MAKNLKIVVCFNLPEGREGFKSKTKKSKSEMIKLGFNLPEGREGFKSKKLGGICRCKRKVSIYPKAEKGLRGTCTRR